MAQDLATEFVADLYRRERSGITRSVARIAGESHAEDLVHDAFVAYLTKSPWATKPGAWVATVARNRALNELRRPKLVPLTGGEADASGSLRDHGSREPAAADIVLDVEQDAIRSVVANALGVLHERSLTALRMKFFEGADYQQIADALGVRVPQAHVIVHRALRRLGRALVNQMADAHGASECAPALMQMAGLSGGDDLTVDLHHDEGPCQTCRPAWDEIVALRIGAWVPAPLVGLTLALRKAARHAAAQIGGRLSPRGGLAADAAVRAATALVAVGVAITLSPSAAPAHTVLSPRGVAVAPAAVSRPGVGTAGIPATTSGAKSASAPKATTTRTAPRSTDAVSAGGTHVSPPKADGQPGGVRNDQVGGTIVCTDISKPCDPPPPGH